MVIFHNGVNIIIKPVLVMDYLSPVASVAHHDLPGSKPPGHLLSVFV